MVPVARRVLGVSNETTLKLRWLYGRALYRDDGATLEDLREAVTRLEEIERIARRVLGGAHPTTKGIEKELRDVQAALGARETALAASLADMRVQPKILLGHGARRWLARRHTQKLPLDRALLAA